MMILVRAYLKKRLDLGNLEPKKEKRTVFFLILEHILKNFGASNQSLR